MSEDNRTITLVAFFKPLADTNRLKIVGLLAQQPHTVEQLAVLLGVGSPTVSHHLRKLSAVGLVEARAEGYYSVYSLRPEVLHEQAKALLGEGGLRDLAEDVDLCKVLGIFTDEDVAIRSFPGQQKKISGAPAACAHRLRARRPVSRKRGQLTALALQRRHRPVAPQPGRARADGAGRRRW